MAVLSLFGFEEKPKRKRLTADDKTKILKRQKYRCAICGRDISKTVQHFDHKKPLALGGSDTLRNIQALCGTCHAEKTREDRAKIAKKKRKTKKEDPLGLGPLFSSPPKRRRRKKDPWDIF